VIAIDELVEIWVRAHQEAETNKRKQVLDFWREACQSLRPTPEDNVILEDEEEKR
jgi:hypothetical protein